MTDLEFPEFMLARKRWLVSTNEERKRPQSPLRSKPSDYPSDGTYWKFAWNVPQVWVSFLTALEYWASNKSTIGGLCYVLHPGGETGEALRLICLDFDKAFSDDGALDPAVESFLEKLGTFVEYSQSGRGLHAFVLVRCKPFSTSLQRSIGNVKFDILCSNHVAVTGKVYKDYSELREVPAKFIEQLGLRERDELSSDIPDIWEDDSLSEDGSHLIEHMEEWEPCYRSSKGSQLGEGGDVQFFHAACHLARHGVTGREADRLLQHVPADPPFTEEERRHKIECAYRHVAAENEFGIFSPSKEFAKVDAVTRDDVPEDGKYGFTPIPVSALVAMDLAVEYAVEGLLVDGEGLFIGGREKTFKTCIAADLAASLATGAPFLGTFDVLGEPRKTAFLTAEIGLTAAKALFIRVARAKGIDPESLHNIDIIDKLPSFQLNQKTGKLANPGEIAGLEKYFKDRSPDIAIFDPLYLAMIGSTVGDMYAIGGVLKKMDELCRKYKIWPVFAHHARKDQSKEYSPMDLGDLYGSGVSAFARQWLLLSHAQPFEHGAASLYCRAGGSAAGDCGLWRINIFEGKSDELLDRQWQVSVVDDSEHTDDDYEEKILEALKHFGTPESVATIATMAEMEQSIAKATLIRLVREKKATLSANKFQISPEGFNHAEV